MCRSTFLFFKISDSNVKLKYPTLFPFVNWIIYEKKRGSAIKGKQIDLPPEFNGI